MDNNAITEEDITKLTQVFYASVRQDDLLGPVFHAKIGTDEDIWETHIDKINGFWSSIFLKTGRYKGNPMIKHAALPDITPAHFKRWLELFAMAGLKALPAEKMDQFNRTADRIAKSLQMGLAFHHSQNDSEDNPFQEFGLKRPSWSATGAPQKH
jgi:hemoglobin